MHHLNPTHHPCCEGSQFVEFREPTSAAALALACVDSLAPRSRAVWPPVGLSGGCPPCIDHWQVIFYLLYRQGQLHPVTLLQYCALALPPARNELVTALNRAPLLITFDYKRCSEHLGQHCPQRPGHSALAPTFSPGGQCSCSL